MLPGPPNDSMRLSRDAVAAFQRAHAAHVNLTPKRKQFVAERNEKYLKKFAEDERDEIERATTSAETLACRLGAMPPPA